MNIFYVCGDKGIAPDGTKGASIHLRSLATALARSGHNVTVLARRTPADPSALPFPFVPFETADSILQAANTRGRPDILLERYALGHDEGRLAARSLDIPFVLEVNAPLVLEAAKHRGAAEDSRHVEVEERLIREAHLVATVSRPLQSWAAEIRGDDRRVVVLRNGCDLSLFEERVDENGSDPVRPVVGFLGNPKPWHGAEILPPLVARLRNVGHDVRLLLIGGGPGAEAVERMARSYGVEEHLEITGSLEHREAAARLRDVTVAVAPYPETPFFYFCPLKVIEYMAAGLPVVTTALGDLPEIVGGAGVVVPGSPVGALFSGIRKLLADPERRRELGRRARERARTEFTWDRTAADLAERVGAILREREPAR